MEECAYTQILSKDLNVIKEKINLKMSELENLTILIFKANSRKFRKENEEIYLKLKKEIEILESSIYDALDKSKIKISTIKEESSCNKNKQKCQFIGELPDLGIQEYSLRKVKSISHDHGGVWFHPRELINEKYLLTSGRNGIIKVWDLPNCNLLCETPTNQEWVTSIKYDKRDSYVFVSTCSEKMFIFEFNENDGLLKLLKKLKTDLSTIYGFTPINNSKHSLLVCGGFSDSLQTLCIYLMKTDYMLNQLINPLTNINLNQLNKKSESFAKTLDYSEKLNILLVGLTNGIICIYKICQTTQQACFSYYINLPLNDWVYQLQLIGNFFLASNGNSLFYVFFSEESYVIKRKLNFLSSIYDFHLSQENNLLALKLKPGIIILYDFINEKVINSVDESRSKGTYYDNSLIMAKSERLIISSRDNELIMYNY
jgi:hypothetical protein